MFVTSLNDRPVKSFMCEVHGTQLTTMHIYTENTSQIFNYRFGDFLWKEPGHCPEEKYYVVLLYLHLLTHVHAWNSPMKPIMLEKALHFDSNTTLFA